MTSIFDRLGRKARELVKKARESGRKLTDRFVEKSAQTLYQDHRDATRGRSARVNLERYWPQVSKTWQSRYRNIVRKAMGRKT